MCAGLLSLSPAAGGSPPRPRDHRRLDRTRRTTAPPPSRVLRLLPATSERRTTPVLSNRLRVVWYEAGGRRALPPRLRLLAHAPLASLPHARAASHPSATAVCVTASCDWRTQGRAARELPSRAACEPPKPKCDCGVRYRQLRLAHARRARRSRASLTHSTRLSRASLTRGLRAAQARLRCALPPAAIGAPRSQGRAARELPSRTPRAARGRSDCGARALPPTSDCDWRTRRSRASLTRGLRAASRSSS